MTTSYVPKMVTLIDGSEATKTMIDIVYGCLLDISQTNQKALTKLVKKCRDDNYDFANDFDDGKKCLGELVQINLVKLTGESYYEYVPIILTMMDGQTENFKPIHPAPDTQ